MHWVIVGKAETQIIIWSGVSQREYSQIKKIEIRMAKRRLFNNIKVRTILRKLRPYINWIEMMH